MPRILYVLHRPDHPAGPRIRNDEETPVREVNLAARDLRSSKAKRADAILCRDRRMSHRLLLVPACCMEPSRGMRWPIPDENGGQ